MKLYIKWFYWYRNFGDEVLIFWLLNYLQQKYNPETIAIEVGDIAWMQQWISQNQSFLQSGVLDKIELVENTEISRRFKQFQSFLWLDKYRGYFKIFGGWEVLDESRQFPHDGRNLLLLHHYCIKNWNFALVGGIGTDVHPWTKFLFKIILPRAQEIICRESFSCERAIKYEASNATVFEDFSTKVFTANPEKSEKQDIILINLSPQYNTAENIAKISDFVAKYGDKYEKFYFPADINFDKELFSTLRIIVPDLQIYDWTKHTLQETINLFASCQWWIWSRLHFLYPLKLFGKDMECLAYSDKIKKIIMNDPFYTTK